MERHRRLFHGARDHFITYRHTDANAYGNAAVHYLPRRPLRTQRRTRKRVSGHTALHHRGQHL
ncbi:hypothetical protein D6833_10345, partial [Candidatus Parcubacteria bacterium]